MTEFWHSVFPLCDGVKEAGDSLACLEHIGFLSSNLNYISKNTIFSVSHLNLTLKHESGTIILNLN